MEYLAREMQPLPMSQEQEMTTKDLARKIDAYRNLADYVLLTPKEAKRVVTELRRAARLAKKLEAVK
jgi:ribosomal protein S6